MPRSSKFLFVLTDGGRARLVERSADHRQYVTVEELDGRARLQTLRKELRASHPGRSISSTALRRSAVGTEDYLRPAKEAFIGEVAARASEVCQRRGMDGVVVAAPVRLIGHLEQSFNGRTPVAGVIRKDLTKAPNSDLGAWLDGAFTAHLAAR